MKTSNTRPYDRESFRRFGEYGFIRNHCVSDASVHDSQQFCEVLDSANEGDEIWADSSYRSQALEEALEVAGYRSQIHEQGYRNHPLTEKQKATNWDKSKARAKVEHVFRAGVMGMGESWCVALG